MVCVKVKAQQDPSFTMYNLNMNVINPAYAGSNDGLEFTTLIKGQWVGIKDAPNTQTLSISSPIGKNIGLGLSANVGGFNFYIIADNFLQYKNIYNAQSVSLQLGFNYIFNKK